jgi:hypothetical protein
MNFTIDPPTAASLRKEASQIPLLGLLLLAYILFLMFALVFGRGFHRRIPRSPEADVPREKGDWGEHV